MSQTQEIGGEHPVHLPGRTTRTPAAAMRVGDWEADSALNVLARSGQAVHLEPKAMELLVFLARRPGEVVSRDELLSEKIS